MAEEKTEESSVSHESGKGRYVRANGPRLNQGLRRHHRAQVEDFEGPVSQVPQVMAHEGGVVAPCTRLQHLGNSKVVLKKKRRSNTPAFGGSPGKDLPESWYARDIVFRSQKETAFLEISFLLHPAVTNNRSHRGRCGVVWPR